MTYPNQKYIIELKKWYGKEYHQKGLTQLADYLEKQNQQTGYLVIFDFRRQEKTWETRRERVADKDIFSRLGVVSDRPLNIA